MIKYQMHNSGTFPRFFCDTCTDPIQDEKAFVFWNGKGEIAHAHSGPCAAKLGKTLAWPYSEPLIVSSQTYSATQDFRPRCSRKPMPTKTFWT
jgi:hypothetical protein